MAPDQSDIFEIAGDLAVHRLGFGGMSLAGQSNMGWPDGPAHASRALERAIDMGVDKIDTADMYGNGSSECIIGETIDVARDDVLVATKGGILKQPGGADNAQSGKPEYLKNAALRSGIRLRTDTIDLYQYHSPAADTPFEDSIRALAELKDEGVIRHVGLSNVSVEQLENARDIVDVATVQNRYNVVDREHEDLLEACENAGIGFISYSPLNKGSFGDHATILDAIAQDHEATRYQIALAWLLHRSTVLLPIPGTLDVNHLEENVEATAIELTDEEMRRLSA